MFGYKEPPVVISIGGSLIAPNGGIDSVFLRNLNEFIREQVKKGRRFFLVAGGGMTARHYIEAGRRVIGDITDTDLDWLGVHSTRLNAHLLRTIFQDISHPRIIENYDRRLIDWREPVVIGAGWKPGWSTDYDAVVLARDYKAHTIINLSNIDWIYNKDPKKYKSAQIIKKMTWDQMEELVGDTWTPGTNAPFDPIASRLAKSLRLTIIIINGSNFTNLRHVFEGKPFKGTVITPLKLDASFYDREYYRGDKGGNLFKYADSVWAKFFSHFVNIYRALLIRLFLKPKNCLDIGCGTGYLVKWLRFFGIEAFGIEISQDALDMADESTRPYLKKSNISDLPYDTSTFDLVVTYDVLEHVDRGSIRQALSESIRVSRKYILHKLYTSENRWIGIFHKHDVSHVSVFSQKYWKQLLGSFENTSILRGSFFRLPLFFETIFLLRKKS